MAVVSLRLNLAKDAETFREEFIHQNSTQMARGDLSSLRRRLEALSVSYHVVCIEGQTKHSVFFRRAKGSCAEGPITKKLEITSNRNPALKITATVAIPRSDLILAAILIAVQVILLVLLSRTIKLLERESIQHELDKSRAFSALTTMLAHDARRPLAVTKMAVDLLRQVTDLNSLKNLTERIIPEIDQAAAGVEGLILDVMELGRDDRKDFFRSKINLQDLINDVIKGHNTKSLLVSIPSDINVFGNEFKLKRVFANVIENAIDAAGTTGAVKISAAVRLSLAHVSVANTGSFIPPSEQSKIFELFYTSGKPQGTGLGLAISKKIIEGHGGVITCRSVRNAVEPSGLTEFRISIPVYIQSDVVPLDTPALMDSASAKIVIIDDSIIAVEAWMRALGSSVDVRVYDLPEEFFEDMNSNPPALSKLQMVITDFYFEGSKYTGEAVLDYVSKIAPQVPVVLSSCLEQVNHGQGQFNVVLDKKPLDYKTLVQRVLPGTPGLLNRH